MKNHHLKEAFAAAIPNRIETSRWFVCLMVEIPFFGGHEEGGWWGRDIGMEAYSEFPSEEAAQEAAVRCAALAVSLSKEAKTAFNERCANELDRADARGVDYDTLDEVDGEDRYFVRVTRTLPPLMASQERGYS